MAKTYDLIIIGAGPAGYTAAVEAAKRGMKTILVERGELGGTCLNRGCIPTKTFLHTAELYREMKNCESLGLDAEAVAFDMERIQKRKEEVVEQLRNGIAALMKKYKVEVVRGKGKILSTNCVQVLFDDAAQSTGSEDSEFLEGTHILIAAGSAPAIPRIPGIDLENVVTSDELLAQKELYPRLTIIGGGVIGMEFASLYSAFGAQVTVIEFLDRILANMDREISQNLKMILKKRGVEIHTGACVEEIRRGEEGELICCYREKEERKEVSSEGILAAVGRRACTEGLLGDGVALSMEKGRIQINEFGQTSIPSIYAAGDVTGGAQLAHAASAWAIKAVAHMAGEEERICTELIPGCVYTNPEIGTVGLTQEEAKARGLTVLVKKYPMSANGKTVLTGQERGFIKVVAENESHKILGAQMMCARATDMISEFATAIANGLTLEEMGKVIRPHPTFSEAITEAVRS